MLTGCGAWNWKCLCASENWMVEWKGERGEAYIDECVWEFG